MSKVVNKNKTLPQFIYCEFMDYHTLKKWKHLMVLFK